MSQIETVIRASKQLEQLLEQHYGASGRGLHEKTSSVDAQLDSDMVRRLRKIATLRNKVVHEDFEIDDLAEFQSDAEELLQQLSPKAARQPSTPKNSTPKNSTAKNSTATSNQTPNTTAQSKPVIRPPLKANVTAESAKRPDSATPRQTAKTSPSKTLTAQPRVQPRIQPHTKPRTQLTTDTQQHAFKKNRVSDNKPNQTSAKPAISTVLPAISAILVFLAIIWILAH